MFYIRIFILLFLNVTSVSAQIQNFPEAWFGRWSGDLKVYPSGAVYKMEYFLGVTDPLGKYVSRITYGEGDKKDVRDYWLRTIDKSKGLYQTNERNSILIDEVLMNNVLISDFIVEGSRLLITFKFEPDEIIFEVYSSPEKANQSGGVKDIPIVKSFVVNAYQRCSLKRVK